MTSKQKRKRERKERPTKNWKTDFRTLKEKLEYDGKRSREEPEESLCKGIRKVKKDNR